METVTISLERFEQLTHFQRQIELGNCLVTNISYPISGRLHEVKVYAKENILDELRELHKMIQDDFKTFEPLYEEYCKVRNMTTKEFEKWQKEAKKANL